MVTRLKLTGSVVIGLRCPGTGGDIKAIFTGRGDIRPELGNWPFPVSSAAIRAQLASPNFSAIDLIASTHANERAKNPED
jgi:hypothetical protein